MNLVAKTQEAATLAADLQRSIHLAEIVPDIFISGGPASLHRRTQFLARDLMRGEQHGVIESWLTTSEGESITLSKAQLLELKPETIIHPDYRG